MILGKVKGNVVTTVKHPVLRGYKLMVVQPITPEGAAKGRTVVALDVVQAGIGDTVVVIDEGNSGRLIIGDPMGAVRSVIAGIVDSVEVHNG